MLETEDRSALLKWLDDLVFDGHYTQALRQLRRLLKREPDNLELLVLLSECYEFLHQPAEQLDAATAALATAPDHFRALILAASALVDLGRAREAVEYAERAGRVYHCRPRSNKPADPVPRASTSTGFTGGRSRRWETMSGPWPWHGRDIKWIPRWVETC